MRARYQQTKNAMQIQGIFVRFAPCLLCASGWNANHAVRRERKRTRREGGREHCCRRIPHSNGDYWSSKLPNNKTQSSGINWRFIVGFSWFIWYLQETNTVGMGLSVDYCGGIADELQTLQWTKLKKHQMMGLRNRFTLWDGSIRGDDLGCGFKMLKQRFNRHVFQNQDGQMICTLLHLYSMILYYLLIYLFAVFAYLHICIFICLFNANTGLIPPPQKVGGVPSDWFSWPHLNNKQLWTIKLWIWLTSIRS